MKANVIALSALLLGGLSSSADALAVTRDSIATIQAPPVVGSMQVAGKLLPGTEKGVEKYLDGKAGGALGVGGNKSIVFKERKKS